MGLWAGRYGVGAVRVVEVMFSHALVVRTRTRCVRVGSTHAIHSMVVSSTILYIHKSRDAFNEGQTLIKSFSSFPFVGIASLIPRSSPKRLIKGLYSTLEYQADMKTH